MSNERLFLTKAAQGDHQAFSKLYELYQPFVFRFVHKFVKSPEVACDVCQEVFIKLWEVREALVDVNSFKAYVLTVAKNHTMNTMKRAASELSVIAKIMRDYGEVRNEADEELLSQEYARCLQAALESLPPQSREMFTLCRVQGKTYDEAAETMGISRNTVKKHMVRSLKALRYAVEKDLGISFVFFFSVFV